MSDHPSLTSLIKRLENATSRLEDIALQSIPGKGSPKGSGADAPSGSVPPSVVAYDGLISGPLQRYVELSETLDPVLKEQAGAVSELMQAQRQLILLASASQKVPGASGQFIELLGPTRMAMERVTEIRERSRSSPWFNNLSVVSEAIQAFGWVTIEPAPVAFVGDMREAATFYANRVLKEWREKDPRQAEWVQAFLGLLTEIGAYVKEYHTTGLTWNPKGGNAKDFKAGPVGGGKGQRPPVPPRPSGAPAPPPPPPVAAVGGGGGKDGRSALFSALNSGEAITSGLKHVAKDQMTHKNPNLREGGGGAGARGSTGSNRMDQMCLLVSSMGGGSGHHTNMPCVPDGAVIGSSQGEVKKEPRTMLEGSKWVIEHHTEGTVTLDRVEREQVVYIYNCEGATITVEGKVNAVTMDKCRKVGLVVDAVVAGVEVIHSKGVQLQVLTTVPTVTVDNTDGLQLYLSGTSLGLDLLTSASSGVNVLFQDERENDYVERAVPEQFLSKIVNGKVETTPVSLIG